ncbi:MAG: methyltransferase domain-containing protein [Gammaproteobacteria bacterium]|nr:methyltransferase domain-containing protein [Gammaproteobacteria bacterium]
MAILWEKCVDGVNYQVRAAGSTRRLYSNGVFHSQYNPNQLLTGGVWDLLLSAAFFYPPGSIRRVLVLGVGGGSVIQQLRHYVWPDQIVGIELSKPHLYVARKYFRVPEHGVKLVHADAVKWLETYKGPPFDMIIDDLFGEHEGEPVRAVKMTTRWARTLLKHLRPDGMLVANFISPAELRQSACASSISIARKFECAYQFTNMLEENAVGVFMRQPAMPKRIAEYLESLPRLYRAWQRGELYSALRKIPLAKP